MQLEKSQLGWYYIGETWNLYLNGKLEKVHVDYINIDEKASGTGYVVAHYDIMGEKLTTLSLDADDIRPVIDGLEPTDRPHHI